MDDKSKLELLITARNAAKKELDNIEKQLAQIETKGKQAGKGFNTKALAEPLMQLSGGPMASIVGSFKSFLTLGGMIPKIFLGPIGAVILAIGVLEKKFGIVSKSIETVKQVFESLMTLDFVGMGDKISEIWNKPTKASQEAIDKAKEYQEIIAGIEKESRIASGKIYQDKLNDLNKWYKENLELIKKANNWTEDIQTEQYEKDKDLLDKTRQQKFKASQQESIEEVKTANKTSSDKAKASADAQKKITDDAKAESLKRFQEVVKEGQDILAKRAEAQKTADEEKKAREEKEKADRIQQLADEEAYTEEQANILKQNYSEVASFISPLFDNITDSLGGMFDRIINEGASAMDVLKDAFTSFGRMALQMIGKLIAKFVVLSALKALFSGATGGIGGGILNFATKGLDNLLPSYQTDYNQSRVVAGPFNAPVPIMAHGGEIIGHGNRGGSGTTIIVQGHVFDSANMFEKIRMGLTNHQRMTGLGIG